MKKSQLFCPLILLSLGVTSVARATESDCFPLCIEVPEAKVAIEVSANIVLDTVAVVAPRESFTAQPSATSCGGSNLVQQAEELNNKLKPLREIVGYVRSPQGLAFKLVNDNIVKIPAWIGYAMDPLGLIKHKALDEIRTRAKAEIVDSNPCTGDPAVAAPYQAIDAKAAS